MEIYLELGLPERSPALRDGGKYLEFGALWVKI